MELLYADAHAHVNPTTGLGARKVASKFKEAGGWFMALVALSPRHYGLPNKGFEDYVKTMEIHMRQCREARESGLRIACLSGFHPADIDFLVNKQRMKPEEAVRLGYRVIDHVVKLCREGLMDGIGEVGRQHYSTRPVLVAGAQLVMNYALERARDLDCIIHLHTENEGLVTVLDIAERVRRIGVPAERVVVHHARPGTLEHALLHGFSATVPGLKPVLRRVFKTVGPCFMVESDYIDDNNRPGKVAYPWAIAENQRLLLQEGEISEEYLYRVNVDNIQRCYNVSPP